MTARTDIAARKSLLAARAELDRMELSLAVRELQETLLPSGGSQRLALRHPALAWLVGVAVPLLGAGRLGRIVRTVSIALAAVRILRAWRAGR